MFRKSASDIPYNIVVQILNDLIRYREENSNLSIYNLISKASTIRSCNVEPNEIIKYLLFCYILIIYIIYKILT